MAKTPKTDAAPADAPVPETTTETTTDITTPAEAAIAGDPPAEPVAAFGVTAPTIGRIVHYSDGSTQDPLAAIVAGINEDGTLNLGVFASDGALFQVRDVAEATSLTYGWGWPPQA